MSASHDHNLNLAHRVELSRCISAVQDRTHTEAQLDRLNELLLESEDARAFYLDYVTLDSVLSSTAGGTDRPDAENEAIRIASSLRSPKAISAAAELDRFTLLNLPRDVSGSSPSARHRNFRWALALAATLLITAIPVWYFSTIPSDQTGADSGALVQAGEEVFEEDNNSEPSRMRVATVTYVSSKGLWKEPNNSFSLQSSVRNGQELSLTGGEVELTYDTGVRLRLFGPARFELKQDGGVLEHGGLVASVPEAGHGFTIETPNGKVIDLGTQFGVVVDDFGFSEVSVFEGKVEAYPTTLDSQGQKKFALNKGDALQWTERSIAQVAADPHRFASSTPANLYPTRFASNSPLAELVSSSSLFSEDDWQRLGNILNEHSGILMRGEPGFSRQPYMISRQQFDPRQGPVTITCDVVVPESDDGGEPSIAILTRAADERGGASSPWEDTLATCVRCAFGTDQKTGDGVLEAATKHESGWEPVKLSWRGFLSPASGKKYRLVMRDDGINVSFTVSDASNPGIKKTVRCRSLFQGDTSFVAVEGPKNGEVLIESIRVTQDSRPDMLVDFWSNGSRRLSLADLSENSQQAFQALIPDDAQLILSDNFDDDSIDLESWKTLGEVIEKEGCIQLGEYVDDRPIDTWHLRPYLLTRSEFSPADGPITIVGRIVFTKNFLTGYGGSFAVTTRCSDAYSSGPAWQNSLVTQGIRSNFWPLGLGTDHSLEIHDKPSPRSITLLAAQGFTIDPRSDSFFFRLIDDGRSVALTVVDANDPTKHETISESTPERSRGPNYIGFESTWGSPVMLDDVRIYRSEMDSQRSED